MPVNIKPYEKTNMNIKNYFTYPMCPMSLCGKKTSCGDNHIGT